MLALAYIAAFAALLSTAALALTVWAEGGF